MFNFLCSLYFLYFISLSVVVMCFTQSQSMTWCFWEALWPSTAKVCRWSRQAIGRTFISITHAFSSVSRWFLESVLGGHGCIRLQLLGKQRWLSTRWAFRRNGFGESVNVTDQSCLRGCGLKVVASKRPKGSFFGTSQGFGLCGTLGWIIWRVFSRGD